MAKKNEKSDAKKGGKKILEAARANQDALQSAGLQSSVIDLSLIHI